VAGQRIAIARANSFANALLCAAGIAPEIADTTARALVLTDQMGRSTHGLAMLPLYLAEIEKSGMTKTGAPTVEKDTGATLVWDGHYLPGVWLTQRAVALACERAQAHGIAAIAIRHSHHIGCVAVHTKLAADQGLIAMIVNSDPAGKRVAPFGGTEALFTPNPFSFGYPGAAHPVLVDTCASVTTTSMTRQKFANGEQFEHAWLLDANGTPTRDPAVLEHTTPRGSLQLVGGVDAGHKGFGLTLMVETLSQGLSGHGRADAPTRWGGNTFVQVIDPDFFAGRDAFDAQTQFFSDACRSNRPVDAAKPVRMPGDSAARHISETEANGIEIDAATLELLNTWADKLDTDRLSFG
jgi:LDH2 family malate/lactate/ureidoglycolate dehydrogenase